jgi:uncharacterized delta-60 repeat protein
MYNCLTSPRLRIGLQLSLVSLAPLLLFLFNIALARAGGPGDLDPTFNGTGIMTTTVTKGTHHALSLLVQPDGKILVVGLSPFPPGSNPQLTLIRYTPEGQLDTTFNNTGIVTTAGRSSSVAHDAMFDSNQKLVVGGSMDGYPAVYRYHANGNLDSTFNSTGIITTPLGEFPGAAGSTLHLRPGNAPVLAGYYYPDPGSTEYFFLAHYTQAGNLDTTINGTGLITGLIEPVPSGIYSMSFQPDGKLLVWGHVDYPDVPNGFLFLTRYTSAGEPDLTFNGTSVVTTTFGREVIHRVYNTTTQPDGKIVITGFTVDNPAVPEALLLARYWPDGSLDSSFNGTGVVTTSLVSTTLVGYSVALQSDGKLVVGGFAAESVNDPFKLLIARYTTDGQLDSTFKGTGLITTPIVKGIGRAITIQPDGKIVLTGEYGDSTLSDGIFVARYLSQEEATPGPALTLSKQANISLAQVGQRITYTYRLTNTGNITLTSLAAEDDRLGPVPLTTTTLVPNAGLLARLSYTPTAADLSSPLVNTVTATGVAAGYLPVIVTATTVVTIQDTLPPVFPATALITPTGGIILTQTRPRFLWQPATDNAAVLHYTLLLTGPGSSLQALQLFTTTQPAYTPTTNLSPGSYTWTVQAHDLSGNTTVATPAHFVISIPQRRLYLPVVLKN